MTRRLALAGLLAAVLAVPVAAQVNGQAPAKRGSEQRREILAALRPSVEAELGPNVEFVVSCIQVGGGWAIVNAEPQRKGGRKISPTILADWENRDGLTVTAVLRFRGGRWHLVDKAIGATDVWYDGLAPRSVMRSRCS